jgi:hypothetical protein
MAQTTATDALLIVYAALSPEEERESLKRMTELHARREAGEESLTAGFVRSLRAVADHVGHEPSVYEYKQAREELLAAGQEIESLTRLLRHFGSWRRAKESLAPLRDHGVRRIEARFRYRQLGKVCRYTDETLRDTLLRAADHWGHPPSVAEFEWWRERELELVAAAGDGTLHLPSANPERKTLGHLGSSTRPLPVHR